MTEVHPLTAERDHLWRHYLAQKKEATIFHTLEYRDVIKQHYRFSPHYLLALDGTRVKGILVSFHTRTLFGGNKIQTLPLGGYCDVLAEDDDTTKLLLHHLVEQAKRMRLDYIELKFKTELPSLDLGLKRIAPFLTTEAPLFPIQEAQRAHYHDNIRKNLKRYWRKSGEEGVTVRYGTGDHDIEGFYAIYVQEMRDKHRSLPKSLALIRSLFSTLGPHVRLVLAEYRGKVIAGVIMYYYNGRVTYEFPAMDNTHSKLCPMDLVVDFAMVDAGANGYHTFDFSITSKPHQSLRDFKAKWGGQETELPFYYLPFRTKEIKVLDYYSSYPLIRSVYRHVPLRIIRIVGPWATRELACNATSSF